MNGIDQVEITKIKVAIPIIGSVKWMGGVTYLHYLVSALSLIEKSKKPQIYLVFRDRHIEDLKVHEYMLHLFDGLIYVGNEKLDIEYNYIQCHSYDQLAQITNVYFPVISDVYSNRTSISWIPDFQHKYLPHMFSKEELESRDSQFNKIAQSDTVVIFSSENAKQDYYKFYPENKTLNRIMRFYLYPEIGWYKNNFEIFKKYNITKPYFICCNQFWKHKDHLTLFKAIKLLKETGIEIKLVLTGAKKDYRVPEYYDELMQYIKDNKLQENIIILGFIDRAEQIFLLRQSIAVIQPSLFEGWGTVLEDCRALGKKVILSDIEIHQEQKTDESIFFEKSNYTGLAGKIKVLLESEIHNISESKEYSAREKAKINVKEYAENFINIIIEAYLYYQNKGN